MTGSSKSRVRAYPNLLYSFAWRSSCRSAYRDRTTSFFRFLSISCLYPVRSHFALHGLGNASASARARPGMGATAAASGGHSLCLGCPLLRTGTDSQPGRVPHQQEQGLCHQGHIQGAFHNKGGASIDRDKEGIANYCMAGITARCHGQRNAQFEKTMTQVT